MNLQDPVTGGLQVVREQALPYTGDGFCCFGLEDGVGEAGGVRGRFMEEAEKVTLGSALVTLGVLGACGTLRVRFLIDWCVGLKHGEESEVERQCQAQR